MKWTAAERKQIDLMTTLIRTGERSAETLKEQLAGWKKSEPGSKRVAATKLVLRKLAQGPSKWEVSFMRRGSEPPYPFGKTKQVVDAVTRQEAIERLESIISQGYKVTARKVHMETAAV